ncbi:MAG: hypothetical protein IJ168_09735 [Eubacterium sp.]|nr:hypothetical protein [Eubacterium sp.]
MGYNEIIDRLCAVVQTQADIIREQSVFIEEQLTVDEAIKQNFADKRQAVDAEVAQIESGLSSFPGTGLREGDKET